MKKIEIFWLVIFFTIISVLVSYPILTPNDVLVKEDTEYLYYKEYRWWGMDSCTYKYHKPIYSIGKIIDVDEWRHVVGVAGKGGHWETKTTITISFDGKTYKDSYNEWICSHKYHIGDKVKVIEVFYPRHNIEYYK